MIAPPPEPGGERAEMRWSGVSRGRPAEFRSTMETGARRGMAESAVGNSGAVVLLCALLKFLGIIQRIIGRGEFWKRVGFTCIMD